MEDVLIKIKGMMCELCKKTVSITKASSDYKKGHVKVSHNTSITDLEEIKKRSQNPYMLSSTKKKPAPSQ